MDEPPRTDGWASVFIYASLILLVAICADRQVLGHNWFGAGKAGAVQIRAGEWWRTITSLTLHLDQVHLVANLVIGGLFGLFAARLLGSGLAWFSILLGGVAGNALNAWIRPGAHNSVGASTAVFAALGMVSAWAWTRRRSHRLSSLARWTPLIGGVVLLGYLGGGGERTDVGAHICGFVSGLFLGAVFGKFGVQARVGNVGQALLATSAVLLLVLGWVFALATSGVYRTSGG
jgi:membrane associated rhomboid family serine protease